MNNSNAVAKKILLTQKIIHYIWDYLCILLRKLLQSVKNDVELLMQNLTNKPCFQCTHYKSIRLQYYYTLEWCLFMFSNDSFEFSDAEL